MEAILTRAKLFSMNLIDSFNNAIVECNAWFLILLAILLVLAFTIYAALQIWCVMYKGMKFSGSWKWSLYGIEVNAECK